MHYDDRLATVLRLRTVGAAVARVQYRQLIDLLGTLPSDARSEQVDAAYLRLHELSEMIPAAERAAMLEERGLRLRAPRLVAALAEAEPDVASAAMRKAQLTEDEWLDLIPALPVQARGSVRHRRQLGERVEAQLERLGIHDRGLPSSAMASQGAAEVVPLTEAPPPTVSTVPTPNATEPEGIGAIVKRIEAYRALRVATDASASSPDAPRLPLGEDHVLSPPKVVSAFDFATDGESRIIWTDPGVAPMAVGLCLIGADDTQPALLDMALRRRQPIRAAQTRLDGAPAIAGVWQIDAAPVFDPPGGRFTGYRGRFRRPAIGVSVTAAALHPEADRVRELLHELRTPVNAIQGFAEIIQQQLFGPTPHEYRALAASIAGDSARILGGFDELERLAKLDSGATELEPGNSDFGDVVRAVTAHLEPHTAARSSGYDLRCDDGVMPLSIAAVEAERLVWRLLAALAGAMAPTEKLRLRLRRRDGKARLTVQLPASLAARDDKDLFHAVASPHQTLSAGMFGTGFTLRLAATEARSAGGVLARKADRLRLTLPLLDGPHLTVPDTGHSDSARQEQSATA